MQARTKKIMFVHRRAPHGSIYVQEALDAVLIAAAFGQEVSLAFIDDGVFALKNRQDPAKLGLKNPAQTYLALGDFEVSRLYVEVDSLKSRGLDLSALIDPTHEAEGGETSSLIPVDSAGMRRVLAAQDVLFDF